MVTFELAPGAVVPLAGLALTHGRLVGAAQPVPPPPPVVPVARIIQLPAKPRSSVVPTMSLSARSSMSLGTPAVLVAISHDWPALAVWSSAPTCRNGVNVPSAAHESVK